MIVVTSYFISLGIWTLILIPFAIHQGESINLSSVGAVVCMTGFLHLVLFFDYGNSGLDEHTKLIAKKIDRKLLFRLALWNLLIVPILGAVILLCLTVYWWSSKLNIKILRWIFQGSILLTFMLAMGFLRSLFERFFQQRVPVRRQYVHPPDK